MTADRRVTSMWLLGFHIGAERRGGTPLSEDEIAAFVQDALEERADKCCLSEGLEAGRNFDPGW